MGNYLFLEKSGKNILVNKKETDKVKELIQLKLGRSISLLRVEYKDAEISLYGNCDSWVTREKAITLAGNVRGVSRVNVNYLDYPKSQYKSEFYTIKKDETLSDVAKLYYNDSLKFMIIYEANREILPTPADVYPGLTLRIPMLELKQHKIPQRSLKNKLDRLFLY